MNKINEQHSVGWMPGATGHDTWSKETKEKMKKVHKEKSRLHKNLEARKRRLKKNYKSNYPHEKGTSVPRTMTGKERRIFKEQFIQAIIDKDYALAESMFNESIGQYVNLHRKKKKQEVAAKMGRSPFKGASMKHYRQSVRAIRRKIKASTKVVDGPESTMRHVHEGKLDEVAPPGREEQVKALKGKVNNPWAVAWASYNKRKKK